MPVSLTFYPSSRIGPISPCFLPTTEEISKKKKKTTQSMKYLQRAALKFPGFHVSPAGPILYKCDVCFPPSCRAMVPSQTVINAEWGWRANAAATLATSSPLLPPSRCPSLCCHGSPRRRACLVPLPQKSPRPPPPPPHPRPLPPPFAQAPRGTV